MTSSQEREREKKRNQYSIFVKPTVRNPIQKKEKKSIEIGQAQSTKKKTTNGQQSSTQTNI
ncbi:MAG: hypothetical protein M5F18_13080 [Asgard group archaeon]|nr:hypothetical protein [Asgard group archaeon]